ncbi:unnamed protein product [Rhizophagus irregularis]|nr:unnamed protein product [Rhizophagus irregularis]
MSHAENELSEFKSFFKDSHEACVAYYDCLSINEVAKEQEKRILSFIEKFNKVKEERGAPFAREELKATLIYSNNLPKPFNYLHGPGPEIPYPDNPSVGKAIQLIGHKIKLYNDDVEVIAVKITKNGIFLNVEKNVEGELIHHEIGYENDIVPL